MQRFFKKIIESLFIPTRQDYTKLFKWSWLVIITIVFLLLFGLSLPPIVKKISSAISEEAKRTLVTNNEVIKIWISFSSLTLELLIAILLGQILLTESASRRLKQILAYSQIESQLILDIELFTREANLKNKVDEYYNLMEDKSTVKGLMNRISRLYVLSSEILITIYPDMRSYYTRVIFLSLITSFPGGLYGLGAFILFVLLSLTKVMGIYLDSPWLII